MTDHGTFIWNELVTEDQERCGPFYSEVLGWERNEVDAGPLGTYTVFSSGGRDVAGMMNPTAHDRSTSPAPRWNGYIAVQDADKTTAVAERAGGTVVEPPHDIPDVGRIAMFTDPGGACVYIMQPITPDP